MGKGEELQWIDDNGEKHILRTGLVVEGPPEMFGLPPTDPNSPASIDQPPRIIRHIDYKNRTITLDSLTEEETKEWKEKKSYGIDTGA